MKVYISIIIFLCFFVVQALSQHAVGIKAGVNFASNSFTGISKDTLDINNITGISYGAVLQLSISEFFALQPEVNFIEKGSETVTEIKNGGTISLRRIRETKYSYLDIPLLAKLMFGNDILKIYAVAGPTFGYALKGEVSEATTINSVTVKEKEAVDFDDPTSYKRFELGGTAGAGIQLNFGGTLSLFADGRYLFGISDLKGGDDSVTIKNKGVHLGTGLLFAF